MKNEQEFTRHEAEAEGMCMKSPGCSMNCKNFRTGGWGPGCLRELVRVEARRVGKDWVRRGLTQRVLRFIQKAEFNHQKVLSRRETYSDVWQGEERTGGGETTEEAISQADGWSGW